MLAARPRRGLTVVGLAEAMGSHRSTNYRHDVGLFAPNTDHLRAAARAVRHDRLAIIPAEIETGQHSHGSGRAHPHEHIRVW
jgi:hypothetical protein